MSRCGENQISKHDRYLDVEKIRFPNMTDIQMWRKSDDRYKDVEKIIFLNMTDIQMWRKSDL